MPAVDNPSESATVNLTVDADDLADDHWVTIDNAAEAWCEATHGKGSFVGGVTPRGVRQVGDYFDRSSPSCSFGHM